MSTIPNLRHYDERRCNNCLYCDYDERRCRLYNKGLDSLWQVCDSWKSAYDDMGNDLREVE